ncbi:hypothetical protein C8R44DRAFT_742824 [Mycena epipterygia]|nr:hypothetical protein C8R44DRAFT_742824 [Mycena epipterygia]
MLSRPSRHQKVSPPIKIFVIIIGVPASPQKNRTGRFRLRPKGDAVDISARWHFRGVPPGSRPPQNRRLSTRKSYACPTLLRYANLTIPLPAPPLAFHGAPGAYRDNAYLQALQPLFSYHRPQSSSQSPAPALTTPHPRSSRASPNTLSLYPGAACIPRVTLLSVCSPMSLIGEYSRRVSASTCIHRSPYLSAGEFLCATSSNEITPSQTLRRPWPRPPSFAPDRVTSNAGIQVESVNCAINVDVEEPPPLRGSSSSFVVVQTRSTSSIRREKRQAKKRREQEAARLEASSSHSISGVVADDNPPPPLIVDPTIVRSTDDHRPPAGDINREPPRTVIPDLTFGSSSLSAVDSLLMPTTEELAFHHALGNQHHELGPREPSRMEPKTPASEPQNDSGGEDTLPTRKKSPRPTVEEVEDEEDTAHKANTARLSTILESPTESINAAPHRVPLPASSAEASNGTAAPILSPYHASPILNTYGDDESIPAEEKRARRRGKARASEHSTRT